MTKPSETPEETWWCNSHQRRATHQNAIGKCCNPKLGGILLPCRCVNLTGIAEIIDEPTKEEQAAAYREGVLKSFEPLQKAFERWIFFGETPK